MTVPTSPQDPDREAEEPRLSELLGHVMQGTEGELNLQQVVDRTGGRGSYLLLVFLCLPFTTPIPLPGVSTVFGIVIGWIALAGSGGQGLRLPGWLGRRSLSVEKQQLVLRASRRLVGWIEKVVRPRRSHWLGTPVSRRAHGLLLAFLSSLLLLPLPVPFTNSLPGYGIILTSTCLMERDGRMIFVAYLVSLLATVYVLAALIGGVELIHLAWGWMTGQGGQAR